MSHTDHSPRLRVALLNHAYVARENQKSLSSLAKYVDVMAIAPSRLQKPGLGMTSVEAERSTKLDLVFKRPLFAKGQYLLDSFGRELARFRPDVVHVEYAPWTPVSLQTALLMRRHAPRAKLVLSVRKNTYLPSGPPTELLKMWFRTAVDRRVDGYFAESDIARKMAIELFGTEPSRIYLGRQLGVDVELFSPRQDVRQGGPMTVGFVGELRPRKGILELVDAAAEVVASGRDVTLRVLGRGPLEADLRTRAKNAPWLEIEAPVPHAEVAPFLRTCDAFAMPSRNEPDHQEHDGHAVMEAMACGVPVIMTRSGILPELAVDGGALFVREAHVTDLAAAIKTLYDAAPSAAALGRAARAVAVAEFALEAVATRRARIYEEVCNG